MYNNYLRNNHYSAIKLVMQLGMSFLANEVEKYYFCKKIRNSHG